MAFSEGRISEYWYLFADWSEGFGAAGAVLPGEDETTINTTKLAPGTDFIEATSSKERQIEKMVKAEQILKKYLAALHHLIDSVMRFLTNSMVLIRVLKECYILFRSC